MNMEDQYESGNRQCRLMDKIAGYTKILSDTKKLADIFTKKFRHIRLNRN
jgi:hypothetical protein